MRIEIGKGKDLLRVPILWSSDIADTAGDRINRFYGRRVVKFVSDEVTSKIFEVTTPIKRIANHDLISIQGSDE